jgi:hypothetical protein
MAREAEQELLLKKKLRSIDDITSPSKFRRGTVSVTVDYKEVCRQVSPCPASEDAIVTKAGKDVII